MYVLFFLLVLAVILGVFLFVRTQRLRQQRAGQSSTEDFEIIDWNRPHKPLINGRRRMGTAANFVEPVRWHNPAAMCLLTGRQAADCNCDTHRSPA